MSDRLSFKRNFKIRILAFAKTSDSAKTKVQNIAGAFKQFNTTLLNGFTMGEVKIDDEEFLRKFRLRLLDGGEILNIEELASLYHLPSQAVETPNIVWTRAKKGEPPANLPVEGSVPKEDLTIFAETDFRNQRQRFGIKTDDRRRHIYTIGRTGTGKTTMIENMAVDDILKGRGVAIVDPHGDFAERMLDMIPDNRVEDVVYFDPADREYPIGFNLLENVNPELKSIVASGLVGIFQKIWAFTWGPRLEYILRNAILALLDYPGATLMGVLKILIDSKFRKEVMRYVKDPVIKEFWLKEFASYNDRLRTEAVSPIQNKVGQFVSSPTIRNIIGQQRSTIDIQKIMNEGKILIINLSKGKIGEDNSALLGAMVITQIQLAAMNRVFSPESERKPFYLFVDEFQNFATRSFIKILSEARKYKLNLTVANQYMAQLDREIQDAILGNVGTLISFLVGAQDAQILEREFGKEFTADDLVSLSRFQVLLKLCIDGETSNPFYATTLPLPACVNQQREKVIRVSRERFGRKVK